MNTNLHRQRCELISEFFCIFSNAARRRICCGLTNGPRTVSLIPREVGITLPNPSHHLRLMRQLGVVETTRAGRHVYYHLADARYVQAADLIGRVIAERQSKQQRHRKQGWRIFPAQAGKRKISAT